MKTYGQYCPIARGSEIFAERWTPIILRNLLRGCRTFGDIAAAAPGLSRALLISRLRELERLGIISVRPKPDGHGSIYEPTAAGESLQPVLDALGMWADRWMEVTREQAEPGVVLWSWCRWYLDREALPRRRVLVRFDFADAGRRRSTWLLAENQDAEICPFDPGFGDDVVVAINDPLAFARWHLGLVDWTAVVRSGAIELTGPTGLRRQVPTWNRSPGVAAARRKAVRSSA